MLIYASAGTGARQSTASFGNASRIIEALSKIAMPNSLITWSLWLVTDNVWENNRDQWIVPSPGLWWFDLLSSVGQSDCFIYCKLLLYQVTFYECKVIWHSWGVTWWALIILPLWAGSASSRGATSGRHKHIGAITEFCTRPMSWDMLTSDSMRMPAGREQCHHW
jgi:hypothetical protein